MTTQKSQEIAFQKLLKISHDRLFGVHETSGNPTYGYRAWPVELDEKLLNKYQTLEDKQKALNETLMQLTRGDFPETRKQMEQERKVIQLTLLARADPNYSDCYSGSIFDSFWHSKKGYLPFYMI